MSDAIRDEWVAENGAVRVILGESLWVLPELPEGSVDAVVTDPPYSSGGQFRGDRTQSTVAKYVQSGTQALGRYKDFGGDNRDQRSYLVWSWLWMAAALRATKPGGVLVCFTDWRQLPTMTDAAQCGGWVWRNLATWWKPGVRMQRGRFSSSAEYLVYATSGPHAMDGAENQQNVFSCATIPSDEREHIAQKPIEVLTWAMSVARPGGVVLDPFCGVATAGIAAIRSGRPYVGIEINPTYWQLSVARLKAELERFPLLERNRQTSLFEAGEVT